MTTEKRLISKCAKGDRKSQHKLYLLLKNRVMSICMRYAKNRYEAQDIFQETFIKVFQNLKKKKPIRSLDTWIYRITVNVSIDYLKARNRMKLTDLDNEEAEGLFLEDKEIIEKLDYEQLIEIIEGLPDGYRVVFNMYIIDGYSHEEIGDFLNISPKTSRSQLSRAKQLIKKKLEPLGIKSYEKAI